MGEELKVNQDSTASNPEELSRQDQWDAIGKSSGTSDNSDLEAAIDEVKTSETSENLEPEASESAPASTPEPDSEPEAPYMTVKESKWQESLKEKERLKNRLEEEREKLAKVYAKRRRLIPGDTKFLEASQKYERDLDEYLRLEASFNYKEWNEKLKSDIEAKKDELLKSNDKDLEAKLQELKETYDNDCKEVKDAVNQKFLEDFLEQQNELSAKIIEEMDKGNTFRKIVHAFRSNKYIKGAVIAAGVAGLAVTAVGLAGGAAAGAISVGFGLTAKGALTGAARGAIGGFLSSRQDSKNSAVRNLQDDKIKQQFEEVGDVINFLEYDDPDANTSQNTKTKGAIHWLMEEYDKASEADRKDNIKRTAIATGLGAALGALSSGVQISKTTLTVENGQIGETPEIIDVTSNLDQVNIAEGHGAYDTFTQMGGNPEKIQEALDIMHSIDSKYGLVPGDSGAAGSFAHTYPGPISSWPDAAQVYIEEVAKEWAKRGLIEPTVIESAPIYGPIFKPSQSYIYDGFLHYLADFATGAVAGTMVGDVKTSESSQTVKSEESEYTPNNHEVTAAEIEKQINEKTTAEIEKQMDERVAAEIEKQINEKEAAEVEKQINEKIAAEIEKQMNERVAAEIEQQINEGRTINQEFESKLKNELIRNDIDFLSNDDIELILTPTSTTQLNTTSIENLANRMTWANRKALKDFFKQPENRNLMTTQFGEWIIANTPDENPRITAEREQSWQV
ncbi:hypothetical protein IJJ02_03170 [Candidatus Saccharibacteria bacterium]|nr:hypothetical protein [Candidatus Saccharibacteria bacterium]